MFDLWWHYKFLVIQDLNFSAYRVAYINDKVNKLKFTLL